MKKLKAKQLGPWCTFCPPKTTKATHVQCGWYGQFACEEHKEDLKKVEQEEDRLTEADYQTWMRL